MGRVTEITCFHSFRRHYGTIWLSPTCLLLLKDAPCFIQNSHTWILGCLAFGQFGVSMTLVYSGRGWVKCGLVLYIIYKFSLSVNTEDYVLWRLTFCLVSGVREGCREVWMVWGITVGYVIALITPSFFLKIQKIASLSSTCRVLKNAKGLNICILKSQSL